MPAGLIARSGCFGLRARTRNNVRALCIAKTPRKNGTRFPNGVFAPVAYVEYQAHAPIGAFAPGAVGKYDGQAHEGEEGKEQGDVLVAEGADRQEHATKEGTDGTNDNADRDSDGAHEHETAIGVDQAFYSAQSAAF